MAGALVRWCVALCGGGGWASLGGAPLRAVRPCGPALLAVGVAEERPRGGAPSTMVRAVWGQALSLPRLPVHWAGCCSPPPTCCRRRCVGVGAPHCPIGLHALWGLCAAGVVGGRPRGVARHRCEGRLVSGAVPPPAARPLERAARVPRPVCPGCGRCGRGDPAAAPQRAPLQAGAARCGGGGRASPGGVPSTVVRSSLDGLLGSATHALWARVCGCGRPTLSPWPACPVGAACRGGGGGPSPGGGWRATVVRGAWCQALSLPRPPVLWSGQPGFRDPCVPGAVDAGVGTQHRAHSVRPCGPALLAVGVAEGRPRGGGPSTIVGGV